MPFFTRSGSGLLGVEMLILASSLAYLLSALAAQRPMGRSGQRGNLNRRDRTTAANRVLTNVAVDDNTVGAPIGPIDAGTRTTRLTRSVAVILVGGRFLTPVVGLPNTIVISLAHLGRPGGIRVKDGVVIARRKGTDPERRGEQSEATHHYGFNETFRLHVWVSVVFQP
jgi:hypothetical protein